MGFAGGDSAHAIATALPTTFFVLYCLNFLTVYRFYYQIFQTCLRLRFTDVESNPGPGRPVPTVCSIICTNVRGMSLNLNNLTVASSRSA